MRRTDRLFEIVQMFRAGHALRGADIAERLGVSLRTVYRDLDTLVASGVPIEGERGVGFLLRGPIFLPPLTLSLDEVEALHFGLARAAEIGGPGLAAAAQALSLKIDAVLPQDRRGPGFRPALTNYEGANATPDAPPDLLRHAVRNRRRLHFTYKSLANETSRRRVRPLRLEWWGRVWTLTAWCETRDDFRSFRVERISEVETDTAFRDEAGKTYADYLSKFETSAG